MKKKSCLEFPRKATFQTLESENFIKKVTRVRFLKYFSYSTIRKEYELKKMKNFHYIILGVNKNYLDWPKTLLLVKNPQF